ncbi:hypothetical protein H4R20_000990 [Coemansia guatemalensis]|uniref:Uncharacterized protein n=1 Tax=Coemansia guatemalensis TaxID=2761395 RepID=A0A9W8LW33_9FUNG|nr:hypothetical protein H4R20_000990 [Coemansia guatemalensis]
MGKQGKEAKKRRVGADALATEDLGTEGSMNDDGSESLAVTGEKDAQIMFGAPEEIQRALDTSNVDLLIQGLTHLREHLRVCNGAAADAAGRALQEAGRRVVFQWVEESDGVTALEAAWATAQRHSGGGGRLEATVASTAARLLAALDSVDGAIAGRKLGRLVVEEWLRGLQRALGTARSRGCAAALQLLAQTAEFGGGELADELRRRFDWTQRAVDELPLARTRVVGLSIRQLWTRFVLAFFVGRCQTRVELLRVSRVVTGLFRGTERDSYAELHALLEAVYTRIVADRSIPRSDKKRVFGVHPMANLARACRNTAPVVPQDEGVARPAQFTPTSGASEIEVSEKDKVPLARDSVADLVVRFFCGLMAFPGHGICYHQRGLYPPPRTWAAADASELDEVSNGQILRILLRCIRPAASVRHARLAEQVLRASPELIAPFWRGWHGTLEPRASLQFLGTTAFALRVLALPLPPPPPGTAAPPALATLVEHVLPQALARAQLGRGLQQRDAALVQYRTLLVVDAALAKLAAALQWLRHGAGEAWRQTEQRLVAAVRQRVPEWRLLVAAHHDVAALGAPDRDAAAHAQHALTHAVLVRVMGAYQTHFGELVLESHFDMGRLAADVPLDAAIAGRDAPAACALLALLRALATTPPAAVRWLARPADTAPTTLGTLVLLALFAALPAVRGAAHCAAVHALQATGLFTHSRAEAACWLDALAALASAHAGRAIRLAHVPGLQRGRALVAFFEDAVAHASRQPHRHVDRIRAATPEDDGHLPFSPLLAAIAEAAMLKAAVGSGALAQRLRGTPPSHVASELSAAPEFALVCEAACCVAEARGGAAAPLRVFLATAPAAVLAPRVARLASADAEERAHLAAIEAGAVQALGPACLFLAVLGTGTSPADVSIWPGSVFSSAEQDTLTRAMAEANANLEVALPAVVDSLAAAARSTSVESVSRWLVAHAAASQGALRQTACVVAITWIAHFDRVPRTSLWDHEPFVQLAPELLQIDDMAFLSALLHHLLVSSAVPALLLSVPVQRLLVHAMLAMRDSLRFSGTVVQLLNLLAPENRESSEPQAVAFVCALAIAHTDLLSAEDKAAAIAGYAAVLGPRQSTADDAPHCLQLDFSAALLVHRSATYWDDTAATAPNVWHLFLARIAMAAAEGLADVSSIRSAYLLALVRAVAPALTAAVDTKLALSIAAALAGSKMPAELFCAAAGTGFVLLRCAGSAVLAQNMHLRAAGLALVSQIVAMWTDGSSVSSTTGRALEEASRLIPWSEMLASTTNDSKSVSLLLKVAQTRTQLAQIDAAFAGADINIAGVLECMWKQTSALDAIQGDAARRKLVAGILASDAQLRARACEWAAKPLEDKCSPAQAMFLAWLLAGMTRVCTADKDGRLCWDDDYSSRILHLRCLELSGCLFGDTSAKRRPDIVDDSNILFIAAVFVQESEDNAAVLKFCKRTVTASMPVMQRARLVRSAAVRAAERQGQPELAAWALEQAVELAPSAAPAADKAKAGAPRCWELTVALASTLNHCKRALANGTAIADAKDQAQRLFTCLDSMLSIVCLPFAEGAQLGDAELQSACECYPPSVYELLGAAAQTAAYLGAELMWFAMLRRLLDCRYFATRVHAPLLRAPLVRLVAALWQLARPQLSPWSVSLEDYFALDDLESLAGAYTGSCTIEDRLLLGVLQGYEAATRQSIMRVALAFGPVAGAANTRARLSRTRYFITRDENNVGVVGSDTLAAALEAVDSARLQRTLADFPFEDPNIRFTIGDSDALQSDGDIYEPDSTLVYDPRFILPWLWAVVSAAGGDAGLLRRLIENNAVGVVVTALASASEPARRLAYFTLDALHPQLAAANALGGRRQCLLLLDALRNSVTERTPTMAPRIPPATALFVAAALPVMLRPAHPMFAGLNRLLLRRPWLRLGDIPLLRTTLRSSTSTVCRDFVLQVAVQAARTFELNSAVFRRCGLINSVLALATSPLGGVQTSSAAYAMLFQLSSAENGRSLAQYVSKSRFSLLAWIRTQALLESNAMLAAAARVAAEHTETGAATFGSAQLRTATSNLTALGRLIIRMASNYPLAEVAGGKRICNRFWAAMSTDQPSASGQCAAAAVAELTLTNLADAIGKLSKAGAINLEIGCAALALVRTCLGLAQLLVDIQLTTAAAAHVAPPLRSPRLAQLALKVLHGIEPLIGCVSGTFASADVCNVSAVAKARFVEVLFHREEVDLTACYWNTVDCLFTWITAVPWPVSSKHDSADIIARALAVGAPSSAQALTWMRDCRNTA